MKVLLTLSALFIVNGCTLTQVNPQNANQRFGGMGTGTGSILSNKKNINTMPLYEVKEVKRTKHTVNSLNTIIPQRKEEVIMRGVMMPYESDGVMHDSSFSYIVVQEAGWNVSQSKKIRSKKVLGGINDN